MGAVATKVELQEPIATFMSDSDKIAKNPAGGGLASPGVTGWFAGWEILGSSPRMTVF